ncbi:MAG TPA: PrsW family glutamic-type intramembrane protease [Pyrinomonadaceae bacterium]|jgi:RsiW-degrading membrane proteinase PrsW (M82 family)/pSer/pThr/pTyr-binding forkhead associated (FHA) protein
MKLFLNIESGSLAGRRFELSEGFFTIGRGDRCNIRFDALTERIASKEHCYIEVKSDGFYLTDNQSTNGTILNGEKIQSARLKSGDRVQFGKNGVTAFVQIEDAVSTSERTSVLPNQSEETRLNIPQGNQANIATQFYIAPESAPGSQMTQVAPKFGQTPPASFQPPTADPNFYNPPQPPVFQNPPANFRQSLQSLGMGSLPVEYLPEPEQNQTLKYVLIAGVIFVIIFLSLIVSLLMFASVGIESAVMASVVAFIPAMFYLLPLVWLDRYDPEPSWLLALAFAWGALVAVIVSFIVNTVLGSLLGAEFGAVISAPLFEEGSKGVGLVLLLIFFRKYFDDILDGIVFAGVIALGFATVENVLYYGRGILENGAGGLAVLFVVRGIMSPFAHVTFTAMTGIGCGISRESHNIVVRLVMPIMGYGCAVLLHAIWNGMAVIGGLEGFILGYLFLEIPFFLIFVGFAFYVMFRQNKILKEMLAIDVARGLIPQEHLQKATSAFSSTAWLASGLFSGNFRARSAYLRSIGKLGLSYWHIQRATAAQGQTASFQQNPILRSEVLRWREQV